MQLVINVRQLLMALRPFFRVQGCQRLRNMAAPKRHGRAFVKTLTLTWYISAQAGIFIHQWLFMPWRQDLAAVDVEPDLVVGDDRAEALGDVAHFDCGSLVVQSKFPPLKMPICCKEQRRDGCPHAALCSIFAAKSDRYLRKTGSPGRDPGLPEVLF